MPDEYYGPEVHGRGYVFDSRPLDWCPSTAFTFKVAGISHRLGDVQGDEFAPLRRLHLEPEPDNPKDPRAIAVYDASGSTKVGYMPGEDAESMHRVVSRDPRSFDVVVLFEWRKNEAPHLRCGLRVVMAVAGSIRLEVQEP